MILALLLSAVALTGSSGLLALALPRAGRAGDRVAAGALGVGAALGIAAAVAVIVGGSVEWVGAAGVAETALRLRVDAISAMFLIQALVIGAAGAVYGLEYWPSARHPDSARQLQLGYGAAVAGLALLFCAGDAILFLVGWEVATLGAWLAFTADNRDEAVRAASQLYLFATKAATLALMGLFALWWRLGSTTALVPLAGAPLGVLVLAVLGFGLKAGLIPLHVWLPGAHGSAPSHVSALMSGALIKAGIYGLVRVLGLCPDAPAAWGHALFALGAISAVLGVVYAIGQHDLKRLLAYHSVENIGIITMALGLAVAARAGGQRELELLGLAAALLHTWNHGAFKALLFLAGGAAARAAGTRQLDAMGGLARAMPLTALAFLLGAAAISGLPPLNGFVSEFLLYQGLLGALGAGGGLGALGAAGAPALALTGALALLCFAKVVGVVFLGAPRRPAGPPEPVGVAMRAPMLALVAICVVIGVLPAVTAPALDAALSAWSAPAGVRAAGQLDALTASAVALALLGLVAAAALAWRLRAAPLAAGPTWDCGYAAPAPTMQYTASSFAEPVLGVYRWATRPAGRPPALGPDLFPPPSRLHVESRDPALDLALRPAAHAVARLLGWLHRLQPRTVPVSLLYLLLAILFAFALR